MHGKFHRKRLYCYHCKQEINCIECRNEEEVWEFKEKFEAGEFKEEAKKSLIHIHSVPCLWSSSGDVQAKVPRL